MQADPRGPAPAAGGGVAEARIRLREIESRIAQIRAEHERWAQAARSALDEAIREAEHAVQTLESSLRDEQRSRDFLRTSAESVAKEAEAKREEFRKVQAREFIYEHAETCPTCGQEIPLEDRETARDHALAEFNRKRAEELQGIAAQGQLLATEAAKWADELGNCESEIKATEARLAVARGTLEAKREAKASSTISPVEDDPAYQQAFAEKAKVESEVTLLLEDSSAGLTSIDEEIRAQEHEQATWHERRANLAARSSGEYRIEELKADEKRLTEEWERLERELYLTDEFIRQKVSMLTERINSRFRLARFQLFETQVNGGVQPVCETTYLGVPYSSGLNNAARMQVGLDIIRTLQEHYGLLCPVWLDNRESVSDIPELECQVVSLYVSPEDTILRVVAH